MSSSFEENGDELDLLHSNERQSHVTNDCSLIMPEVITAQHTMLYITLD